MHWQASVCVVSGYYLPPDTTKSCIRWNMHTEGSGDQYEHSITIQALQKYAHTKTSLLVQSVGRKGGSTSMGPALFRIPPR